MDSLLIYNFLHKLCKKKGTTMILMEDLESPVLKRSSLTVIPLLPPIAPIAIGGAKTPLPQYNTIT